MLALVLPIRETYRHMSVYFVISFANKFNLRHNFFITQYTKLCVYSFSFLLNLFYIIFWIYIFNYYCKSDAKHIL